MKNIQEGYERLQKAKRRLKHEHSSRNFGMCFCWLRRTVQRRVLQPLRMLPREWIYLGRFMNGRGGTWQTSICSLLGKHSKRSCVRKVGHWRNLLKKISGASRRSFCIQTRICSRLGFGFLADHGCGTVPVPKETTQITSSSHNTNLTNHIHLTHQTIAILHWWDDTAHHCCSVNLLGLGMTHIACLPPDPTVHVAWL